MTLAIVLIAIVLLSGCANVRLQYTNAPDYVFCGGPPGWCAETKMSAAVVWPH